MKKVGFILLIALLLRLALSPFLSHPIDVPDWIGWSNILINNSFSNFYNGWSDYLPGYLYVLWFLGIIKSFLFSFGIVLNESTIFKLPAIIADILTGYLIFILIKKYFDEKRALISSSIYLFNPAIFYNSSLWGQIDSITALFSLLALVMIFEKKIFRSSLSFVLSFLTKPTGILIAPLVGLILLKKSNYFTSIKYGVFSFLTILVVILPFINKPNIFDFISERISTTFGQYPFTSIFAFNFWYLVADFWKSDLQTWEKVTYHSWGFIIFILITFLGIILFIRNWSNDNQKNLETSLVIAALIFIAGFLFLTRVHERQLHSAITFLSLCAAFQPKLFIYYLIFSLTYIFNLTFSHVWISQNFTYIFNRNIIFFLSSLNVATFLSFSYVVWTKKYLKNEKSI